MSALYFCTILYSVWCDVRSVRLMEGGADSGFRHVEPEKYQSRLFHFCGTGKNVVMSQVNLIRYCCKE